MTAMTITIDSNIFIYWLEGESPFHTQATELLKEILDKGYNAVCSSIVMTEILAKPGASVEALLKLPVTWQDCTLGIATRAGQLRQSNPSLKTPDAIHLATALEAGALKFFTHDAVLRKIKLDLEIVGL
jgi:predicted nucleic acid-binding protein